MSGRKVLGKGLGALIPGAEGAALNREPRSAPVDRIVPSRFQPRTGFDDKAIERLAESIREQGVLEPLIVRPNSTPDGDYELVAGERRWRAAAKAGLDKVPVIVRELSDREALELALTENLQREDLNPIEEARGYKTLKDEFKMTQDDIARRVGVERSTVANSLRLLKLEESIQQDIARGVLSAGHARALLAVEGSGRNALWRSIVDKGLTVRQTELQSQKPKFNKPAARSQGGKTKPSTAEKEREYKDALDDMAQRLARTLGTKVKIRMGSRGGVIEVRFTSRNEMEAIFDRILGS